MDPFKAYDIRGIYPFEVNEVFAEQLGKAIATYLEAKQLVVGYDGRTTSKSLFEALVQGICSTGTNVISIGLVSTPQFYYKLYSGVSDGGVMITASHNPKQYNGFKICGPNAKPIFKENGLPEIESIMQRGAFKVSSQEGILMNKSVDDDYQSYFKKLMKPLHNSFKIAIDTGNGMGIKEVKTLQRICQGNVAITTLFPFIDGTFPNHECNPVVEKNLVYLQKELQHQEYDLGIAFDGDADRVVFLTSKGEMIPPDMMTALLATEVAHQGDTVGFEVRSSQIVDLYLKQQGFKTILSTSGHAYIKESMKQHGMVFAGEKSGHYFYQRLHNTDSSLYSVLLLLMKLDATHQTLDQLARPLLDAYVQSGELNYEVQNPDMVFLAIEKKYSSLAKKYITIDGISVYTDAYFFNIRKSNTEPLVRVNIEAKTKEILLEIQKELEYCIARS